MKTVGEKIAELRKERGLTQENLAGIIGVSSQAVSKWENNATMPDVMLLPLIADTLGVTIDELFGIRRTVGEKSIPVEETPMAVYHQILNTMWNTEGDDCAERIKSQFEKDEKRHTGFISMKAGAVYANKDLGLSYLPSGTDSIRLLEDEKAAELLRTVSDKHVRLVLQYQCKNAEQSFTAPSVAAKTGISEEEAENALEKLCRYNFTSATDVEIGSEGTLRVYHAYGTHKMLLLLYPLLSLAERLADYRESWCFLRA